MPVIKGADRSAKPGPAMKAKATVHKSRDRWSGSENEFYEKVLKPTAAETGRSICQYSCELPKTENAKTLPDEIPANHKLLGRIHAIQNNLSLVRSKVKKGLQLLLNKKSGWGMSEAEQADFVITMERRILNITFVVSQALKKTPKPKWTTKLPWITEKEESPPAVADSIVPAAPSSSLDTVFQSDTKGIKQEGWILGFSGSSLLAWRVPDDKKVTEKNKEYSQPVDMDKQPKNDNESIRFYFDGDDPRMFFFFENVTVGAFKMKMRSKMVKAGPGPSWTGTLKRSRNAIEIVQKVDRGLLLVINENGKQICQVRPSRWHAIENEQEHQPNDHPAIVACTEFLKELATLYCRGDLLRTDLQEKRDELLNELDKAGKLLPARSYPRTRRERASSDAEDGPRKKRQKTGAKEKTEKPVVLKKPMMAMKKVVPKKAMKVASTITSDSSYEHGYTSGDLDENSDDSKRAAGSKSAAKTSSKKERLLGARKRPAAATRTSTRTESAALVTNNIAEVILGALEGPPALDAFDMIEQFDRMSA